MNPKRWKWYTWIALFLFSVNIIATYNQGLGSWSMTALSCLIVWASLAVIHYLVVALFRFVEWASDRLGKMPPPPRENW